eukprot:7084076-Prymnesium_polylepis.1
MQCEPRAKRTRPTGARTSSTRSKPSVKPPSERPPTNTAGRDVRPVPSAMAARRLLPRRPRSSSSSTRHCSSLSASSSKRSRLAARHHGQSTNEKHTTGREPTSARMSCRAAAESKPSPAASTILPTFQSPSSRCSSCIKSETN